MTKNYTDLIVWQKAMTLVTEIYRITMKLPKDELLDSRANFVGQQFPFPVILPKDKDDYRRENFDYF